jgi:hypothetical protein
MFMEILKNEEPGPRCSLEQLLSTIEGLGLISSSEKKKKSNHRMVGYSNHGILVCNERNPLTLLGNDEII